MNFIDFAYCVPGLLYHQHVDLMIYGKRVLILENESSIKNYRTCRKVLISHFPIILRACLHPKTQPLIESNSGTPWDRLCSWDTKTISYIVHQIQHQHSDCKVRDYSFVLRTVQGFVYLHTLVHFGNYSLNFCHEPFQLEHL